MRTKTEEEMASLIKNSASMDEVKAQQLNEIRKALLDIRDILKEQSKPKVHHKFLDVGGTLREIAERQTDDLIKKR